jgi:hypothetical protein
MYAYVMAKDLGEKKSSRIKIPPHLKEQWWEMLDKKGLPQQTAVVRLVEFVLAQDDPIQSMVLAQVDPTDDLIELVLRRMKAKLKYRSSAAKQLQRNNLGHDAAR